MSKRLIYLLFLIITLVGCNNSYKGAFKKNSPRKSAPSGKYRNPTIFSRVNPFQGKAKARLSKSKRKKLKLFKKRHRQNGRARKGKKPGSSFKMKRTISRGRLKSSGSRINRGGGGGKRKKNLFNTRKK